MMLFIHYNYKFYFKFYNTSIHQICPIFFAGALQFDILYMSSEMQEDFCLADNQ